MTDQTNKAKSGGGDASEKWDSRITRQWLHQMGFIIVSNRVYSRNMKGEVLLVEFFPGEGEMLSVCDSAKAVLDRNQSKVVVSLNPIKDDVLALIAMNERKSS